MTEGDKSSGPVPRSSTPLSRQQEQSAMALFETLRDAQPIHGCQFCSAYMEDGCLRCKARAAVLSGWVQAPF